MKKGLAKFSNKITNFGNKMIFKTKKNSSEILLIGGLGLVVTGTVLGIIASYKITKKAEEKDYLESTIDIEKTEEEKKKEERLIRTSYHLEIVKQIIPVIVTEAAGITFILASHNIIKRRNLGLIAAYTTLSNGFGKYRANVIDTFGKEVDEQMMYGNLIKKEKSIDISTNEEKEIVRRTDFNENLTYSRFFDECSRFWEKNMGPGYNLGFVEHTLGVANSIFNSQGYMFLNDVYELLGFEKTAAGQVVGWVKKPKSNKEHDTYIDFGLNSEFNKKNKRDFLSGKNPSVLLEFNVMGYILDEIPGIEEV